MFSKSVSFDPKKDFPHLSGKVILVTGGNNGLGKQCVLDFAQHKPAQVWLAARNMDKARSAAEEIRQKVPGATVELLELDLASLTSVKRAAETFLSKVNRLDILMLNAGIMATPPALTTDGYEIQFGTNHVGHALLTKLLMPLLLKTADAQPKGQVRVICLSSIGHNLCPKTGIEFDNLKSDCRHLSGFGRYGQSKLANVLFARKLGALYPQLLVAAIHPGGVQTNISEAATDVGWIIGKLTALLKPYIFATVEKGAYNQLWASVTDEIKSGEYYTPVGVRNQVSALGKNDELAGKLWSWTEREVGIFPRMSDSLPK